MFMLCIYVYVKAKTKRGGEARNGMEREGRNERDGEGEEIGKFTRDFGGRVVGLSSTRT